MQLHITIKHSCEVCQLEEIGVKISKNTFVNVYLNYPITRHDKTNCFYLLNFDYICTTKIFCDNCEHFIPGFLTI